MKKPYGFYAGLLFCFTVAGCIASWNRADAATVISSSSESDRDAFSGPGVARTSNAAEETPANGGVVLTDAGFNLETGRVTLNNGIEMPILGIGTFSLSPEQAEESVYHALLDGYRLIDTANAYMNERAVGRAIKRSGVPREEIFVTTKLWISEYEDAERAIDETLARLDLDYIDLLLLHQPYGNYVEGYRGMEQAVREGKVRAIGLSNFYQDKFEEIMNIATITPALVQNETNPYFQQTEMKEYLKQYNTVLEAWYPLGGRGNTQELFNNPTIAQIAQSHGKSSAQVILRWHLQAGSIAIPGSSNPDHIQENFEIFDFELSDDEMARIGALDTGSGKYDYIAPNQEQEERFLSSAPDFNAQE